MPSDTSSSNGPGPGSKPVDVTSIVLILILLLSASAVDLWTLERLLRQPISATQAAAQDSIAIVAAAARDARPVDSTQPQDTTRRTGDSVASLGAQKADSVAAEIARAARQRDSQQRAVRQATTDSTLVASRAAVDARLFIIVLLSGALGGLLHGVRSFVWYVGNRDLKWSWVPTYITLPMTSALLAATMYFVVRAGFLGFQGSGDLNAYGFAGASALIGLFSQAAILKLKEVAETLFTRPPQGADARPEVASKPGAAAAATDGKANPLAGDTAEGLAPVPVIIAATLRGDRGKPILTIKGNGFRKQSQVVVNATTVPSLTVTSKELTAQLPDDIASAPALKVQIITPAPGGGESAVVDVVQEAQRGARND